MYNTTSGSSSYGNTGMQNFIGNVGKHRQLVLVPSGTEIATQTLADTLATWTTNINAAKSARWFPLPKIVDLEVSDEGAVRQTTSFGYASFVREGKLVSKYMLEEMSIHNKKELAKLDLGSFDAYIVTDRDWILGYSSDNVKFLPKQCDYIKILPESQNTGTENAHVSIEIQWTDAKQFNELEVSTKPNAWYPSLQLSGVKDLIPVLTSVTATAFAFTLTGFDGVPYSAAAKEDIYLRKTTEDAVLIAITSITESGTVPGSYTGVVGTQTSGTFYFSLLDQPTAATDGVETPYNSSLVVVI